MYAVVEAWTPKPTFFALSRSERAAFFADLATKAGSLAASGVEPLGWGRTDPGGESDLEHGSGHEWFAVWQVPDGVAADAFFAGVASSDWYDYFEQTNTRGELRSVEAVVAELVDLDG